MYTVSTPGNLIYLNTASCGLLAPETIAAANELYAGFEHNASTRSEEWRQQAEGCIRQAIGTFVGASAKNIAMIPNFSWAMNGIVQSLKGTERVLLYKGDYPSLLEPFRINKFDITWLDAPDGFNIDMGALEDALTTKSVDILAISHVQWSSGYKSDIKFLGDLCKQHGVLFIVDATQSMGACTINLAELNIDVFAASNYKWMNAGFGTAIMYMSDSFFERYTPVVGGNNSYKLIDGQMKYLPSVQSYEPGHPNMYGLTVLESAIKQKTSLGVAAIEVYNTRLAEMFLNGLHDLPVRILGGYTMQNRCSMIFLLDENGLGDWIKQQNIVVTHRNGLLRVSMHYYNTEADVQALIDCIRSKP